MPLRRGVGSPKSVESGNLSVNKAVIRCRQNCVVREKEGDFHKRKVAHMALEPVSKGYCTRDGCSGYLLAFIGAGLTSVATILAFSDLGELVAFFLAIVANHLDGFSKMAGMLGIDRRKRRRRRQRVEKPRWRRQPCSCPSWRTCRSNA